MKKQFVAAGMFALLSIVSVGYADDLQGQTFNDPSTAAQANTVTSPLAMNNATTPSMDNSNQAAPSKPNVVGRSATGELQTANVGPNGQLQTDPSATPAAPGSDTDGSGMPQ